jgi:hypothetical protein
MRSSTSAPAMDATNLPGAWRSTGNALGEQAFLAKDTLFTVDDLQAQRIGPKDQPGDARQGR